MPDDAHVVRLAEWANASQAVRAFILAAPSAVPVDIIEDRFQQSFVWNANLMPSQKRAAAVMRKHWEFHQSEPLLLEVCNGGGKSGAMFMAPFCIPAYPGRERPRTLILVPTAEIRDYLYDELVGVSTDDFLHFRGCLTVRALLASLLPQQVETAVADGVAITNHGYYDLRRRPTSCSLGDVEEMSETGRSGSSSW